MAVSEAPPATKAALLSAEDERWRAFLLSHPDALPYHHPTWVEALAEAYNYEPLAAVVRSPDGEIVGGLPLVEVGGRLRTRRWVSLPFTDVCPPLTTAALGEAALGEAVDELRREREIGSLEVRSPLAGFESREEARGVRHELELRDPEALFAAFKPQVRRNIRKAEKVGLEVRRAERARRPRAHLLRPACRHQATARRSAATSSFLRFPLAPCARPGPRVPAARLPRARAGGRRGLPGVERADRLQVRRFRPEALGPAPEQPALLGVHPARRVGRRADTRLRPERPRGRGPALVQVELGALERPLGYTNLGQPRQHSGPSGQLLRPLFRASPGWMGRLVGTALLSFRSIKTRYLLRNQQLKRFHLDHRLVSSQDASRQESRKAIRCTKTPLRVRTAIHCGSKGGPFDED